MVLVLAFGSAARAQDYRTGIGLKLGNPYGLTVKHFLNESNALEGVLASNYQGFVAMAFYENEHWTGWYPGINWFWGFGGHIGFWDNSPWVSGDGGGVLGADFIIGLEYTFDEVPINLQLDIIPSINLIGDTGWNGPLGGLSVRYVF